MYLLMLMAVLHSQIKSLNQQPTVDPQALCAISYRRKKGMNETYHYPVDPQNDRFFDLFLPTDIGSAFSKHIL